MCIFGLQTVLRSIKHPLFCAAHTNRTSGTKQPMQEVCRLSKNSRTRTSQEDQSANKLQFLAMGDETSLEGAAQELPDRFPALLSIIQGPMIDVHADEPVRQLAAHIPRISQGVLHCFSPMIQAELNARAENAGDRSTDVGRKSLMNHVATERQRQPIGLPAPPGAQVLAHLQTFLLIREL